MYFIEVTAAEERKSFIPLKGDSMHSWPVAFYGKNWLTKINDDGTLYHPSHTKDTARGSVIMVK